MRKLFSTTDIISAELEQLASEVETQVFNQHMHKNRLYNARVRKLKFNLEKNKNLREQVLNHQITPKHLCLMSDEVYFW